MPAMMIPRRMPLPDSAPTQNSSAASLGCLTALQYSSHHGPSLSQTRAMRQSDSLRQRATAPTAHGGKRRHCSGGAVRGGEATLRPGVRNNPPGIGLRKANKSDSNRARLGETLTGQLPGPSTLNIVRYALDAA